MFYSHEILTKREYGVATVWLVATLGSKSTARKIARKDILNVNVPKACETVSQPKAPLALRLQSNLLWGIARVYSQQCNFLYHDVTNAHSNITRFNIDAGRLLKINIAKTAGRQDQLNLIDDPTLLPELLPELDLDILEGMDLNGLLDDDAIAGSIASIRASTRDRDSIPLGFPSSPGGSIMGGVGFSVGHPPSPPRPLQDFMLEDPDFEFNADGEMRDITPLLPDPPGSEPLVPGSVQRASKVNSEDLVKQFQRELEEAQMDVGGFLLNDDIFAPPEEDTVMKDASPFDIGGQEAAKGNQVLGRASEELGIVAPVKKKREPRRKIIVVDDTTRLTGAVFRQWRENYLENMVEARNKKAVDTLIRSAKANAATFVLIQGIGGPLANMNPLLQSMFSGQAILDGLAEANEATKAAAGVRVEGEGARSSAQELQEFGDDYDLPMKVAFPDDFEIGRNVSETGRQEEEMPWNKISSKAGSEAGDAFAGAPFSAGVEPSSDGPGPADFELGSSRANQFSSPHSARRASRPPAERMSILGTVQEVDESGPMGMGIEDFPGGLDALDEFEYFGAEAGVPTQHVDTQQVNETLERESNNFLQYIKTKIDEQEDEIPITFDTLVKPNENRPIVAAQALHHLLLLATKGKIFVSQEEPYGTIQISLEQE